jgi:hypothetical protein
MERVAGIKFLSKYLVKEYAEEKGRTFLDVLFNLIEKDGECCENGGANEVDKAWLRLAAATAILKLGCHKHYEQYITPNRFQQLALLPSVCFSFVSRSQFSDPLLSRICKRIKIREFESFPHSFLIGPKYCRA